MRSLLSILSLSALLAPVQSLYFYIDGTTPKCFFEELPKDTLVVGHYTAEEYDNEKKSWSKHEGLNIFISVDVFASFTFLPYQTLSSCSLQIIPNLTSLPGSIRQRPPRRLPKRFISRPLHIQRRRLGRP
jgi:hypothetical protein